MLIQKLRLQRGWSQQQLADLSGLSARTIQRLENGQAASVESLKSLAAVFEVDFQTLQGESAMPPSPPPAEALTPSLDPARPVPRLSPEEEALRYVRRVKDFYRKLVIYVLVIALLAAINWLHSPERLWAAWVALGWGFGLLVRALTTFDALPFLGPQWEKRQVEKRLGRKL